jgi:hypothetical protein
MEVAGILGHVSDVMAAMSELQSAVQVSIRSL